MKSVQCVWNLVCELTQFWAHHQAVYVWNRFKELEQRLLKINCNISPNPRPDSECHTHATFQNSICKIWGSLIAMSTTTQRWDRTCIRTLTALAAWYDETKAEIHIPQRYFKKSRIKCKITQSTKNQENLIDKFIPYDSDIGKTLN